MKRNHLMLLGLAVVYDEILSHRNFGFEAVARNLKSDIWMKQCAHSAGIRIILSLLSFAHFSIKKQLQAGIAGKYADGFWINYKKSSLLFRQITRDYFFWYFQLVALNGC